MYKYNTIYICMYILLIVSSLVYYKTHKPLKICFLLSWTCRKYLHDSFISFHDIQNVSHKVAIYFIVHIHY